jgi:alkylation response protein AidB-like acyl-CoA dehydrogenase
MDFSFTEAQDAVTQVARKLFTERLTPQALKAIDAGPDRFSPELWAELAASGLLGTAIPEEFGGSGHGLLEACSLLVEAGAAVAPLPIWASVVLGAMPVAQFGSPEQRARLLPGVADGTTILTAALMETGAEEPTSMATRAVKVGDAWILTGVKSCVPAGFHAHRVLVSARTEEGEIGLFIVNPEAAGVTRARQVTTNREVLAQLTMVSARVDGNDVLVAPSRRGRDALDWLVQRATVGLCAMELGIVERALRMTAAYTTARHQFDRPIATFQAVSQRAGDAFVDVEAVRLTTWQAAWQLADGRDARDAVEVAKYWACEAGHRVVYAAQHLHGGIGFDLDYPLHRYYVWSKQIELTLGSASVHLARIGAQLAMR